LLEIPGFILQAQDANIVTSVAVGFYIKIDQAPAASTSANILSFMCDMVKEFQFSHFKIIL